MKKESEDQPITEHYVKIVKGAMLNPKLHEVFSRLQKNARSFFIEDRSFGDAKHVLIETIRSYI